eukprot:7435750-Prorocentrum_lima.AAC.1
MRMRRGRCVAPPGSWAGGPSSGALTAHQRRPGRRPGGPRGQVGQEGDGGLPHPQLLGALMDSPT